MALRWLTRKTAPSEDRTLTRASLPPSMLASVPGGAKVTPQSALSIADAYACIRALADAAASLPLIAYRRTANGRERIDGRTAELLRHPAPATTQAGLIGQMVAHLNLYGNAYLGKFRDGDGKLDQLALLQPDRVHPELKGGQLIFTVTGPKGERSQHGPADIIHIKALTTDGLVGLSPVRQARAALGLSASLREHAARFFDNDGRPGGILSVPGATGPDNAEAMGDMWRELARPENAHRTAVMSAEVSYTPISMPADDMQFLQQRELSAQEVARIFRVPPWIVGARDGGSMTYSNTEQQSLHFVTYSLRPWLVAIEQALSADADLFGLREYAEFLLDALLRADSATRAEVYTRALDPITGWMNREEVRRLENLEPEQYVPRGPAPAPTIPPEKASTNGSPSRI